MVMVVVVVPVMVVVPMVGMMEVVAMVPMVVPVALAIQVGVMAMVVVVVVTEVVNVSLVFTVEVVHGFVMMSVIVTELMGGFTIMVIPVGHRRQRSCESESDESRNAHTIQEPEKPDRKKGS